jgi:hypothetical protein
MCARQDRRARQLDDGSYVCIHEPLNVGHLLDHLRGEITLGAYLPDQESRARFVVLDADDAQAWKCLGHLARALADEDVPSYLERSRRGGTFWLQIAATFQSTRDVILSCLTVAQSCFYSARWAIR